MSLTGSGRSAAGPNCSAAKPHTEEASNLPPQQPQMVVRQQLRSSLQSAQFRLQDAADGRGRLGRSRRWSLTASQSTASGSVQGSSRAPSLRSGAQSPVADRRWRLLVAVKSPSARKPSVPIHARLSRPNSTRASDETSRLQTL